MTKRHQKTTTQPQQQEDILLQETAADNRRRALKTALATGVVLSSTQWLKPVINAVVLPAHAQTSDVSPTECVQPSLVIQGLSLTCGNSPATDIRTVYRLEGTACPVSLTSAVSSLVLADPTAHLEVFVRVNLSGVRIQVFSLGQSLSTVSVLDNSGGSCGSSVLNGAVISHTLVAPDGTSFQVDGAVSFSGATITLDDITLTPI